MDAQGIEDYDRIRAGKRVEAVRIDDPIVLDGRLDEPAWLLAKPAVEFYQQAPDEGELAVSGGCKLHICGGRKLHTRHPLGWAGDLSGES